MYSYPTTLITAFRMVINSWLSSPNCRFLRFNQNRDLQNCSYLNTNLYITMISSLILIKSSRDIWGFPSYLPSPTMLCTSFRKEVHRSLLDLKMAEARQILIICQKTSLFFVWLNFLAQLNAKSLYQERRSQISYILAKISKDLILQGSLYIPLLFTFFSQSSKLLMDCCANSKAFSQSSSDRQMEANFIKDNPCLLVLVLLSSMLSFALQKLSSDSFFLPALRQRSASQYCFKPACMELLPQNLTQMVKESFIYRIMSSLMPRMEKQSESISNKSLRMGWISSSQQSAIPIAFSKTILNSSVFSFLLHHSRQDLVRFIVKKEGGSSLIRSQRKFILSSPYDAMFSGGQYRLRQSIIHSSLFAKRQKDSYFLSLGLKSQLRIFFDVSYDFIYCFASNFRASIPSGKNLQQLLTLGSKSFKKPGYMILISSKIFLPLLSFLRSQLQGTS